MLIKTDVQSSAWTIANDSQEMAKKAFFLNDPKVTANELVDNEYLFVVCTWQFVMSRFTAYRKNLKFFELLATKGSKWIDENATLSDRPALNVRHVNALYSHVYHEVHVPIRHLVLDEAQFAKNITTRTYDAVRHLTYDRILLLSGTFLANRWHDLFALISLIPGHPFQDYEQFLKTFAHKEDSGYYSTPSVSKRNRLVKFLMGFTISRPVSVLSLPPIKREFYDFVLTADEEASVAEYVRRFVQAMSTASRTPMSYSGNEKKALLHAVLAQLSCANTALHTPPKHSVQQHFLRQALKLKERFAEARRIAGGEINLADQLAMITPEGMRLEQAVQLDVTEELLNVSLEEQQGEVAEIEGDVPRVVARDDQAYDPAQVVQACHEKDAGLTANETFEEEEDDDGVDDGDDEDDDDDEVDYEYFKPGEDRSAWLARLKNMPTDVLFSSKVRAVLDLVQQITHGHPGENIIVFSRFLKFLDMLGEANRRSSGSSMAVPLQFNGTLTSEQRSFSQNTFNDPANKRPIFITAGSGGAGLNLTGGSQIIQCEPWWNLNDELQAHSRAWRMGQLKKVHTYCLRGTNSLIDYVIETCQKGKNATNTEIMIPLRRTDDESVTIPRQYQGGVGDQ